jgi:hypothetical protein
MRNTPAVALAAGWLTLAPVAHADPDNNGPSTQDEICGAYNLGVPPDQIAQDLHRNNHRINEWQAQKDTNWPILQGDCG